jgi:hypothetical protein
MSIDLSRDGDRSQFIGIPALLVKHSAQVNLFQAWAKTGQWEQFHINHYDWWAFPINRPSSHGFKYTLGEPEIDQLKANPDFMAKHRLGAQLMLLSWGWEWQTHQPVPNPDPGQAWAHWPIRLEKCTLSMELFGHHEIAASCNGYAKHLVAKED